jgi:sugar/nucleoside kinase (ribokinase family)
MNFKPDIIAIGHIVREQIVFPERHSEEVLGSPAAYSSVAIARLGGKVGLVSLIGTDMPDRLLGPFRESGVDLEGLKIAPGEPTTATRLVYDPLGNKTIEYPAKAKPLTLEDIPECYRSAKMFNICTMDHDVQLSEIERMVKCFGGLMAVDLGGYGGAHVKPVQREPGVPEELPKLVRCFDLVKASDEDCRKVMADPSMADEEFGHMILDWGAKAFVATRGHRGALVMTPEQNYLIPPYQGRAIDPTGGGDTFFGGYLLAYLRTGDFEYAGRFGAATALCMIEQTGGVWAGRFPTLEMVESCMKRPQLRMGAVTGTQGYYDFSSETRVTR